MPPAYIITHARLMPGPIGSHARTPSARSLAPPIFRHSFSTTSSAREASHIRGPKMHTKDHVDRVSRC